MTRERREDPYMLSFRDCWDTYDAIDEALAIEMKEALTQGDLDRQLEAYDEARTPNQGTPRVI